MKRISSDYVQDIIDSARNTSKFIEGMDYNSFIEDEKTVYAVIRAIEVIGEASKNIPSEVKELYPTFHGRI